MKRSLFVLGDSISIHYGPYLARMTADVFHYGRKSGLDAALHDLNQALGANGGDSRHVLDYLEDMSATERWHHDVLLLNCGLHDIKTDPLTGAIQVPLVAYTDNLARILLLAKRVATHPVWVSSTPVDDERHQRFNPGFIRHQADLRRYNAAAAEQARLAGIPVADLGAFTEQLGADLYADHVHFTEPIRQLQAAFLAGFVLGLLKHDES
ncbi:MAG: SGNH/GDSL hydrolase family protein [Clostridiaceae bacterium]|nr:SGNH/GDSL hydrolase family protein [Clostridiaceae bacterium]